MNALKIVQKEQFVMEIYAGLNVNQDNFCTKIVLKELMEVVKFVINAIYHALNVKEIQKLAQIAKMVYIRNLCVDII